MIDYATNFKAKLAPVPLGFFGVRPGQGAMGYGSKISTDIMVQFPDHPRWYRVYCVCWSNSGTCYVRKGGRALYFQTTAFDHLMGA